MPLSSRKKNGIILSDLWGRGSDSDDERRSYRDKKPPELDKLWRRFSDRLNRLFGRGGSGRPSDPSNEGIWIAGVLLIAFCAAAWAFTGSFIVQDGQVGLVMTFGKHTDTKKPGFNWRWPYPFQSHEIVNVSQVRKMEIGYRASEKNKQFKEALMPTADGNIIDIQFAVQYKLKSATEWVFNNRDKEEKIRQVAESVIRETVGRNKMEYVLFEGKDKIAQEVAKSTQAIFDSQVIGVQITAVTVQAVQAPDQVQMAYDDLAKATQDRDKQKGEGQAYANEVIPKAKGVATRLMQEAEAHRAKVVANAEGDAARFKQVLAEYQKAPVVTRDRMYIETMQHILTSSSKVLVDTKGGSNLLYLPLDKIMAQTAASEAARSAAAAQGSPVTPPATGMPAETPATQPTPAAGAASAPAAPKPASTDAATRARENRNREAR